MNVVALFNTQSLDNANEHTNSPALEALIAGLDEERKYAILDLGAASAGKVAYFSQWRCRLFIQDGVQALREIAEHSDALRVADPDALPDYLTQALAQVLRLDQSAGCDLVLLWDILNYLPKDVVIAVAAQLAQSCLSPGAYVHALISPNESVPLCPGHFDMVQEERLRLRVRREAPGNRPGRRYHQPDMEKMMPQFVIERTVLLGNGLYEYLFRYEP